VTRQIVDVTFNEDGSVNIEYVWDFANNPGPGVSPIEFVDIGLPPRSRVSLGNVSATVNGNPVRNITEADPQFVEGGGDGISLDLRPNAIQPGQTGQVYVFIGGVEGVIYSGGRDTQPDYISFEFTPSWFGSQYAQGPTDMTVTFYLPPGIQPDEPIYYTPSNNWPGPDEPESAITDQDRIYYSWSSNQASPSTRYVFGAGFPERYVPAGAITSPPLININTDTLCCIGVGFFFALLFGLIIFGAIVGSRKRKLQYLPPKISIEGHGIKRGLTAIEAAVLMEQPMDKVLTMVLFSTIKKGAAVVARRDPLEIEVNKLAPELQPYENDFLNAFQAKNQTERRKLLQDMMIGLVKSVSEKMKGFSRKETIDYYQTIMTQAWAQVEAADTPEVKGQKYEEVMDWTMLDRRFGDRTQEVFGGRPVIVPTWWHRYDPVYRGGQGGTAAPRPVTSPTSLPTGQAGGGGLPRLPGSDFAASMVNGMQSFSANVIGDLTSFTGGVTNKTNPVPKTTYTSGRSGGGGGGRSCACACACAGCACACAGGGR
jgi:hypothetical protein